MNKSKALNAIVLLLAGKKGSSVNNYITQIALLALLGNAQTLATNSDPVHESYTSSVNRIGLPAREKKPEKGKVIRVMVDPGHGGDDLGARGAQGPLEKETTLRISRTLRQEILRLSRKYEEPVEVRLTRDQDLFVPLKDRARTANEWGADLFLSIHLNASSTPQVKGFEVYFLNPEGTDAQATRLASVENGFERVIPTGISSFLSDVRRTFHVRESSHFAEEVYQAMALALLPNKRGVRQAPFAVLSATEMPSLLIEVGYVTHPEEREKLKRAYYLKRVAGAISEGIFRFIRGKKGMG